MTVRVNGFNIELIDKTVLDNVAEAVVEGLTEIMKDAQSRTPVVTGTLQRSAMITIDELPDLQSAMGEAQSGTDLMSKKPSIESITDSSVIYGSFNTTYAVEQHEDLELKHIHGGGPKFLESAYSEGKDSLMQNIKDIVDQALS